jgi:hypothetical protein
MILSDVQLEKQDLFSSSTDAGKDVTVSRREGISNVTVVNDVPLDKT